jgi:hypothetical protein
MMEQIFNQMKAATAQVPPGASAEERAKAQERQAKVMELIKSHLRWEKLKPHYMKIYSETFTDAELDGMLAFYESPAGRAMLEKMPGLMVKSMALVQEQMRELMPEIQRLSRESQAK